MSNNSVERTPRGGSLPSVLAASQQFGINRSAHLGGQSTSNFALVQIWHFRQ